MFSKFQKRLVLIIAICLCVTVGSGLMRANAGQDNGAMLENWFNGKKSQSVNEIDVAIEAEKSRLMGELSQELNQSIGGAAKEIEQFTDAEKARRIQALRDYAASLMAGIDQGGAHWDKQAYLTDVEKTVQKAIQEIDKAAQKAQKHAEKNQPKKETTVSQPGEGKQPVQPESSGNTTEPPATEVPSREDVNNQQLPPPPANSEEPAAEPEQPSPDSTTATEVTPTETATPAEESGAE